MEQKVHHLIFEGPELVGKSFLMHGVYDFLERKYNQSKVILDGCHWFNADVGVFGTQYSRAVIENYMDIVESLRSKNIMFEKFHLADIVYHKLYHQQKCNYTDIEEKLLKHNFKIVLGIIKEDEKLLQNRINDRLSLYPHYKRILKSPDFYIRQQQEYLKLVEKTKLDYLIVDMTEIPNKKSDEILKWLGEK